MKKWIVAMRLRTLPLALASIGMGVFLAVSKDKFDLTISIMCFLTTLSLQILSNLANDYGDSVHGADHAQRQGPQRAVQAGEITSGQMKTAIKIAVVISLALGIALLFVSKIPIQVFISFLALGVLSIVAAILYTNGKLPYGYIGLGDISVYLFFGILGVLGTFYLQTKYIDWTMLLPATSCGLLTVGVLNINNIRDIDSDIEAGKRSIPVMLGKYKSRIYHLLLLTIAMVTALVYISLHFVGIKHYIFLFSLPLFILNAVRVYKRYDPQTLDPLLKQLALSTVLFVALFGLSINLS
ncbi:1,4-dihydroxy-2-naphthoate polyprenyltransferase [bacterium]|nr:1,4-dihydroxy-2-naphthoate polyprenyltransferase [bacterium]